MMHGRLPSRLLHIACACLPAIAVTACSDSAPQGFVTERVVAAPLTIRIAAEGELKSTKATPLLVPGQQFTNRQLAWILPDGSHVEKGDLIARFSAEQSKHDLAEALIDLQRNTLAHADKQSDLDIQRSKLEVEMAKVETLLDIAHRYANADQLALARNTILDSVQDEHFLTTKQGILSWRLDQSGNRGAAELATIDAKRATLELKAGQKRADLDALEVRAPHAGVLVLKADWSGATPHVGSAMWAGNAFASLPDPSALEAELWVPESQAGGVAVGDTVELHPLGKPSETATTKLSWIAAAAQPRSRKNPVKYASMKAPIPAGIARRYGWTPGQRFTAHIVLLDAKHALSVPNLALEGGGDGPSVKLIDNGRIEQRRITLGVRGPARSQVIRGLEAGDTVLLDVGRNQDGR